jgi:amidase
MDDELWCLSATEQRRLLLAGEVSARELVSAHLERVEQTNPAVNAIVTVTAERAMDEAVAADRRHARGEVLGLLHGLPLAVKDTHDTAGVRTTYGSPVLVDNVPETDELVVRRERAAGAIVIGKTNVPEFAAGSHTFNPVFGATRNPYDLTRSAGGSSGGAAAALACGMVPLADGSDMGGSLRNPASFCNVVGLRPTPGRVPTWPSRLPWSTMSVQGPMGRTVSDVRLLLAAQAGPDDRCPISIDDDPDLRVERTAIDTNGLRIAWSPDLGGSFHAAAEVVDALRDTLPIFEDLGCTVAHSGPDLTGAEEAFRTARAMEFAAVLGPVVDANPGAVKQSIVWNVECGRRLSGADVARAEELRAALFRRMADFFRTYDALVLPVSQVVPFNVGLEYPTEIDGRAQETYLDWMRSAYLISATGCPAMAVPATFSPAGLPIGIQIVGPPRSEARLMDLAEAFHLRTGTLTRRPALERDPQSPGIHTIEQSEARGPSPR